MLILSTVLLAFCLPLLQAMSLFQALVDSSPVVSVHYFNDGKRHSITESMESQTLSQHPLAFKKHVQWLSDTRCELVYSTKALRGSVRLSYLEFTMDLPVNGYAMMAEGFQSWSHSKEMDQNGRISAIPRPIAWATRFELQSDQIFYNYSGKPGVIHSVGYTYLRPIEEERKTVFIGSISENTGYTYFKVDYNKAQFSIYKEIDGKNLFKGETLDTKVYIDFQDDLDTIWKGYATYYPKQTKVSNLSLTGWTSWYNTYERITEDAIMENLAAIKKHNYPIDLFQIDDGFQTAVGDWLDIDSKKFPRGMQALAMDIKEAGFIPGLWLAPFAAGIHSQIVKNHPHWIVTDSQGEFLLTGPNWGGFYGLDIYNPEVRDYLQQVLDVALEEWGYGMLKLDFLFAAAMTPRNGKTRGEILWDSIDLIHEIVRGRAIILGSGTPLPAVWGRFDYCRISNDVSPWWDHSILRLANVKERVSTANALVSTLHRWPMRAMLGTDPDVFFIRSENNKLTTDERYTLFIVNVLLGQMILMSDNVDTYTPSEHRLYASLFPKIQVDTIEVQQQLTDIYHLRCTCGQRNYIAVVNLSSAPKKTTLPDAIYFEQDNVLYSSTVQWHNPNTVVTLRPHQTRLFLQVEDTFAGSTGHSVPGWEIKSWHETDQGLFLELRGPRPSGSFTLYLQGTENGLPETLHVDGQLVTVEQIDSQNDMVLGKVEI
ncbi:glycoside hydrolase superfamily [Spinellus fusiger]|nr:glycoside hydrolase superfamily [Spinellus fusiger]